MISVSAGDYHGGDYLMRGLSGLGEGLANALQRYQEMKDQQTKADMLMATLAQTPDPTEYKPEEPGGSGIGSTAGAMDGAGGAPGGPMGILMAAASGQKTSGAGGTKPKGPRTILDPKSYERYLAMSGRNHAAAASGLMGALQMFQSMQKAAGAAMLDRAQVRQANAHADYYERRADPTKELNAFQPGVSRITKTDTGEALDSPIDVLRVSPQVSRPLPKRGEIAYDEETNTYSMDGKLIDPEKIAAARALKPKATPSPTPSGPGFFSRMFHGSGTPAPSPSATPRPKSAGQVKVFDPNGRPGLIPAERLEEYLANGYTAAP